MTSKGCYQVTALMLKAKIRPKTTSPATAKMSREVMFDIPPRHFGKRWGDEIFTVALLYAVLVICLNGPDSSVNDFGGWRQIRLCMTKSEIRYSPISQNSVVRFSPNLEGRRSTPGRTTVKNFGEGIFPKFLNLGSNFFFAGPYPKPEVDLAAKVGGICRASGEI